MIFSPTSLAINFAFNARIVSWVPSDLRRRQSKPVRDVALVSYPSWETLLADPRELGNIRASADGTYRIKDLRPGVTVTLMVEDKFHAGATSTQVNVVGGKTVSIPTITLKQRGDNFGPGGK